MPNNINAASRLHSVLIRTHGFPANTGVVTAWAKIFEVESPSTSKQALRVSEMLGLLHRELELVAAGMQRADIAESVYTSQFQKIEDSISPLILGGTWGQVTQHLTSDTMLALSFCTQILPNEENQIDAEELARIVETLAVLQGLLKNSQLPVGLRDLIAHHVSLVLNALAAYPIAGAKALREASQTAIGEIVEAREIVLAHKETPEISALSKLWAQVKAAADIATTAGTITQLGRSAWDLLTKL